MNSNNHPNHKENRLILLLLKKDPAKNEISGLLNGELDGEYIYRTAQEHRIVPLIFKSIKKDFADKVSADLFETFQNRYQKIAKYNFFRSGKLIKIINLLEKNNLPILAYKGMALAEFAYKDVSGRQFSDIDLLIRKKDFPKAKKLLAQIDCQPAWELSPKQEKAVLKYYYEYPFFFDETRILVEVHWDFMEHFFGFDFDTEQIWNRTEQIKLYGKEISTLSSEDYLIVLCSHGSKHFWKRLSWICDVGKLVENTKIDWKLLIKRAEDLGSLRMVWLGLYLAKEILNTKLPDEIEQKILGDEYAILLGEEFKKSIFAEEKEPEEWIEMAKIHLLMREKLGTKIKYSYRLFKTKLIDKLFMPMGRPQ